MMKDILRAAGMGAAVIVGMYAGAVACAVATGALLKRGDEKQVEEAPKQEQPQAQVAG